MSNKSLYYEWDQAKAAFMKHVKNYDEDYYSIEVVLNKEPETIIFHKDDLDEIIEETISAHPMCPLYAEARQRVFEESGHNGHRYPNLNWRRFEDVVMKMLDLSKPVDKNIIKELRDVGYNPTMNIDPEDLPNVKRGGKPARFYFNILLHKQWKAKRDIHKSKDKIIQEIYNDLLHSPKPFHTNRYLPSMLAVYGIRLSEK